MASTWGKGWTVLTRKQKEHLTDEWERKKLAEWEARGMLKADGGLKVGPEHVVRLVRLGNPALTQALLLAGQGYKPQTSERGWRSHGNYGKGRRHRG